MGNNLEKIKSAKMLVEEDYEKNKGNRNDTKLKKDIIDLDSAFFRLTLSKLREYHGTFKSVCENFSMDFNEFKEIFEQINSTEN